MLMDKRKHRDVFYIKGEDSAKVLANEVLFRSMNELNNEFFEVEMCKKQIVMDLPCTIGFMILQYAKLRMLQFHYNFLYTYFEKDSLAHCQSDTDSYYISLAAPSLEDILKNKKMKRRYYSSVYENCNDEPYLPNDFDHFIPRSCCEKHRDYDCLQPALFKTEYVGDIIVLSLIHI